MNQTQRRKNIIDILKSSNDGVSGTILAKHLGVSRQIVVQDIALIRAKGYDIISTNKGYIMENKDFVDRIFKMKHTQEQIEDELSTIIDFGGKVKDVFVYHKSYGVVRANIDIKCRKDIKDYINNLNSGVSTPLMHITSDYHYHTVVADTKEVLDLIQQELGEKGFLAELRAYEPVDFWSENESKGE